MGGKSSRVYFWRPWFPPNTFSRALGGLLADVEEAVEVAERELERYLGARHVLLMPSGTAAIRAALAALLPDGPGEVLLPSLVCEAVPLAVKAAGREPRFVEVDPETFNIDKESVGGRIGDETAAIIAVHQFGTPCDMAGISRIAEENDLLMVEDAAQALGADYGGRKAGTVGDVGILSFNNKVVSACGGGAIVTDSEDHFLRLREYREGHCAFTRKGFITPLLKAWLTSERPTWASALSEIYHPKSSSGMDMSISLITPIVLRSVLPSLDLIVQMRRANFDLYNKHIEVGDVKRPNRSEGSSCTYYTLTFKDAENDLRDKVQATLRDRGIDAVVTASSTHQLFEPGVSLPVTENLSRTILSLPTHPHLGEREISHISRILKETLMNLK